MILRLLKPDAGRISFHGQDISQLDERQMKPLRKQIQIIFQDPYGSLNPRMTAGESVIEGLRTLGLPRGRKRSERLDELFTMVGMSPEYVDRYPHEFSGGQRQRIGIARALSVNPSLIICDEPISALDVSIQAQIINLLKDLQKQLGLSYLFISHDLNVVGYLCSRVAVMYKGVIMEHGPAEVLFEDARHPYTSKLLSAIPEPDPTRRKEETLTEEDAADLAALPEGCVFQDRCPDTDQQCQSDDPEFKQVGPDHFVRCRKVADP
jgi:oligopeptide/dipeptide ABC transporter ATP-binding protein